MERPGVAQEPGSVRAPAGVTSGQHLLLPLTVTAVLPRGILGDRAHCQLRLYYLGKKKADVSPSASAVTFSWRRQVGRLSCTGRLTWNHGRRLRVTKRRPGASESASVRLLSAQISLLRRCKMRQLTCRNGESWLRNGRCVGCQAWHLQIE